MNPSYLLSQQSLDLLSQLLGQKYLVLHTKDLAVHWGRSAMAVAFSINISTPDNYRWIVIDDELWGRLGTLLEFDFIQVYEADHPKDVPYVTSPSGYRTLRDSTNTIEIHGEGEARISSISILDRKELDDEEGGVGLIHYDHTLLFEFDNGQRFAISAELGMALFLEFTTDTADIAQLLESSSIRVCLQYQ